MKFLKALATPFVALWRWIKETAWVQPLLIVGVIFAVIFSIPSITTAIQNAVNSTDENEYFDNVKFSLYGAHNGTSDVDTFMTDYEKARNYKINGEDEEEYNYFKNTYGEKFFFVLTSSKCSNCEDIADGYEYLQDNWSNESYYGSEQGKSTFRIHSIICDETFDDDDETDYYKDKTALNFVLDDHTQIFEDMINFGTKNNYYLNLFNSTDSTDTSAASTLKSNIESWQSTTGDNASVPLIMLFDLTNTDPD